MYPFKVITTRTTEGLSQIREAKETGKLNEMWDPGIEKKNSSGKSGDVQIKSVV